MLISGRSVLVLFGLGIGFALWAGVYSPSYKKCEIEHGYDNGNHEAQQLGSSSGGAVESLNFPVFIRCEGVFIDGNNGAVTAIATVAVAVLPIILAIVTDRQAKITSRALDLSREEFNSIHRPKLEVSFVRIKPIQPSNPLAVAFSLVNTGTGVANVSGSAIYVVWRRDDDIPVPIEQQRNDIVTQRRFAIGASDSYEVYNYEMGGIHAKIPMHQLTNITRGPYLVGWIVYEDSLGIPRTTYICRKWDRFRSGHFKALADPDYNQTH